MPKVSIILTSFNHEKYICEAISSALRQTFIDFELIIFDDCSTDSSWALINHFKDSRIRVFRNSVNVGPTQGVNKAIFEFSIGEYIAIHHSDDIWELDKLEKQVTYLDRHSHIGVVFTQVKIIDESSAPFLDAQHHYSSAFRQHNRNRFDWLRFFFLYGNCLCHPSALVRRSSYMTVGFYDRRLAQIPDLDMWIRMCLRYEIHILDEPLVKFRVRADEANQSGARPETVTRCINERLLVLRNYTKIKNEQDLCRIFPELCGRFPSGSPASYQLAMYAVEMDDFVLQAFGLELLYMLMADESTVTELELFGFSPVDLIALSGRCDFSDRAHLFRIESDLKALGKELHRIKHGFYWQVTKPLRFLVQLLVNPRKAYTEAHRRLLSLSKPIEQVAVVPFDYEAVKWVSMPKIAVICHMYYIDMADEFKRYLLNIPFLYKLYITTDSEHKRESLQRQFSNWKGEFEIRISPNRGRDIAPAIITCLDIYTRYEYLLHIHTKKSPHHHRLGRWRQYLLESLLGSTEVVESIFEAFRASSHLGMIAPQHFEAIRNTTGWGKNFKIARQLAQKMGIEISRNGPIEFPSGSMFWARTAALKPLLDSKLSIDDFPYEVGQVDETLAHAIERLFYFSCEQAGYRWLKISHSNFLGYSRGNRIISNHTDLEQLINDPSRRLIK